MRISILTAFLFALALQAPLNAGSSPGGEDDILRPVPYSLHVGPYIGGGWVISQGVFNTLCDCEYRNGDGVGFEFGAFADYPLSRTFSAMVTLGYRFMQPSYDKLQTRTEYIEYTPGNGGFAEVDYELETVLQLSVVELGMYGRWELPVRGLYVAAGPVFGYVIDDNISETERILTPGIGYETHGGTEQILMDDPLSRYYDVTTFRVSLSAKLGYIITVNDRFAIAPELSMMMSLSPVVSNFQSWKLNAYQGQIHFRFAI